MAEIPDDVVERARDALAEAKARWTAGDQVTQEAIDHFKAMPSTEHQARATITAYLAEIAKDHVVVPKVPDEAKAEYHYIDVYRLLGEDGTRAEVAKRLAEYCASEVRAMIEAAGEE